jgi:hypothetical protein
MMTILGEGAAVFEVDFAAVVSTRTACDEMSAKISFPWVLPLRRAPTAPLGISTAGTAVHDLQVDWVSVSSLSNRVVSSISLGADEFKAFSARKIVVRIAWCTGA